MGKHKNMRKNCLPEAFITNPRLHAYLLLSRDYEIRKENAILVAKSVLCLNKQDGITPCGVCPTCKKIDAKSHPDCIFVLKSAKMTVDDIRDVIDQAYLAPIESDGKVFVLEDAHEYNEESQNALLKTLEEPPKDLTFIMTASSATALLPTVRSRVCTIMCEARDEVELQKQIKSAKPDLDEVGVSRVMALISAYDDTDINNLDDKKVMEYARLAVSFLTGEEKQPCFKFPKEREDLLVCLRVFMLALCDIAKRRCGAKEVSGILTHTELSSCNAKVSLKRAHALYDVFEEAYIGVEGYSNINATIAYLSQNIR